VGGWVRERERKRARAKTRERERENARERAVLGTAPERGSRASPGTSPPPRGQRRGNGFRGLVRVPLGGALRRAACIELRGSKA